MAKRKAEAELIPLEELDEEQEFADELIKSLNTSFKERIAFNLDRDVDSPTNVKYYISTGSILLDYIISNKRDGGIPSGRLIEVAGLESVGKSFVGYQLLAQTQKIGGIAILIDTENSTDKDLLPQLGLDTKKLIYLQPDTVEDVFATIEHTVKKIKENNINKPVTIVWDSVAATPAKAELDAAYDANTMGLGARVVSRSLRKIMKFIGDNNVTLVFINQLRMKLNLMNKYEDPYVTPYGKAIPFHASVRIRLTHDTKTDMVIVGDDKSKDFFGVGVKAKIVKNKISPPFRTCTFSIEFYKGVTEHYQIYDKMVQSSPVKFKHDGKEYQFTAKNGKWHEVSVVNDSGDCVYIKKFYKKDPESTKTIINAMVPAVKPIDLITGKVGDAPTELTFDGLLKQGKEAYELYKKEHPVEFVKLYKAHYGVEFKESVK